MLRRAFATCLVVTVIGVTSGCDLVARVVGEACSSTGEVGRDATHVLKCGDGGTWETIMTLEEAYLILDRLNWATPTAASDAPVEQTSGCAISRRYARDAEGQAPVQLKYRALVTTIADSQRGCSCVVPREWSRGMDLAAAQSLRNAMDDKEREAFANYAKFGVGESGVPTHARTIFFRHTWRSFDEQACLRRTLGSVAAPAGNSRHELGLAVDLEDWERQFEGGDDRLLRTHGWCRTVRAEGWHYEYRPGLELRGEGSRCLN